MRFAITAADLHGSLPQRRAVVSSTSAGADRFTDTAAH